MVTVKSTGASEGSIQRRTELEGPADPTVPPSAWPASDARSLILELAGDALLVELVLLKQVRRKRVYSDGATTVELSLDDVEVLSGARLVDRFTELEIELMAGDEAPLIALKRTLDEDPELTPSMVSKLDTALAAVQASPAGPELEGLRATDSGTDAGPPAAAEIRTAVRAGRSRNGTCSEREGEPDAGPRFEARPGDARTGPWPRLPGSSSAGPRA